MTCMLKNKTLESEIFMSPLILAIDDDKDLLDVLKVTLTRAGYRFSGVHHAQNAVEHIERHSPDFILCDVDMPETSGMDILAALSQRPAPLKIPFVFLSAYNDQKHFRQGMSAGADDYLYKPLAARELLDTVETQLLKYEQLRQGVNSSRART